MVDTTGKPSENQKITVLLQNGEFHCSPEVTDSVWIASSPSSVFQGSTSMADFESSNVEDGFLIQQGKKRRLTSHQVEVLEKNFDVDNKLEPDRKIELGKQTGLQPRQVAVWFQNRRARSKNKQIEKDYACLLNSYDQLKDDYQLLIDENENLKKKVLSLKDKLGEQDNKEKVDLEEVEAMELTENTVSENLVPNMITTTNQEDASSAKSGVFDSDTSNCNDGNNSSFLKLEDDHLENMDIFPKLEQVFFPDRSVDSCNSVFSTDDQPFWSSLY